MERKEHIQKLDLEERFRSLPPRQREVFALITAGFLNKQVAAELGISERTVKVHRERLRRKMGADSLAELARMASTLRTPLMAPSARLN
jgi:RNA polymerase sigma factor (sigma-70 family)